MRIATRIASTLLALLFLSSCAATFDGAVRSHALPPATRPPRASSRAFASTFDVTWRAAMRYCVDQGSAIELSQKESGVITLKPNVLYDGFGAGELLRGYGYPPECNSCDYSVARETMSIFVEPTGHDSATVRVVSKLEGWTSMWGWKPFTSAGIRESAVLDSVAERL